MRNLRAQLGATIIELLVSVAIGLVIAASMFGVYINSTVNSTTILKTSKLNQELTTLMTVMVNDIRRAGYWKNTAGQKPQFNPFADPATTSRTLLAVVADKGSTTSQGGRGAGECILYSYDANIDNQLLLGDVDADGDPDYEIFGFRLNNGVVEMLQMGENAAHNNDCGDNVGTWLPLTDKDTVSVDHLDFDLASTECLNSAEPDGNDDDGDGIPDLSDSDPTNDMDNSEEFDCFTTTPGAGDIILYTRVVQITLAGSLVSDPSVKMSLTQNVRVRNEFVAVAPVVL